MKPTISRNRSLKLPEAFSLFSTAGGEHFLLSATQGISLLSWNDTEIFIFDSIQILITGFYKNELSR